MQIAMQGNWTVRVKSKNAAFPHRFIITGATSGNGTYVGATATPAVNVTGANWIIKIMHDAGAGFQISNTRLKFPQKIGGNYVFDIQSNDAGADEDFDDLILTCSTPVSTSDYLIYGNVSLESGICFRPCHYPWLVIDTLPKYHEALRIPSLRKALEKLYPKRVKPFPPFPPEPDPGPRPGPEPYFRPMIVNLLDDFQIPPHVADVYRQIPDAQITDLKAAKRGAPEANAAEYRLERSVTASNVVQDIQLNYDRLGLSRVATDLFRLPCETEPGANITINFEEYDRTAAELAGDAYTGDGDRNPLGSAITDMFGNYIFRFRAGFFDRLDEVFTDVGAGEDFTAQVRPDLIVKAVELSPAFRILYESAPYFNVPNLKRINICMPRSRVSPTSFCFNGNLLGSLGNVFLGGDQNTAALTTPAALDRNELGNHLDARGVISVHNPMALFTVDCACWAGTIDLRGCLFNIARKAGDPIIRYYTIRYKKPVDTVWSYVTESYLHPQFRDDLPSTYIGDQVGPFPTTLQVDGGPAVTGIPAYINIQAEAHMEETPWRFDHLDRYMQLRTDLYEGDAPGTVYFRIDGYDAGGAPVPGATDLIALYLSNQLLDVELGGFEFLPTAPDPSIEHVACGLYRMSAGEMNTPLRFSFRAEDPDPLGFVNHYLLTFNKCPTSMALRMTSPATADISPGDSLVSKVYTGAATCAGYRGSIHMADFSGASPVEVVIRPATSEGGWLGAAEEYGVFSFGLTASRRVTNGYNSGIDGNYPRSAQFSIIRR